MAVPERVFSTLDAHREVRLQRDGDVISLAIVSDAFGGIVARLSPAQALSLGDALRQLHLAAQLTAGEGAG